MDDPQVTAESMRGKQRAQWTASAPGWRLRAQQRQGKPGPFREDLVRLAQIADRQRALDLACGAGEPALILAERVGPNGSVLGLDITAAMIDTARERAQALGLHNVEFRVIASELELGVPAATFDVATCGHGLMFMPDPVAALRALHEALKPGGRVAVSTLGPPDRCPFVTVPLHIIGRHATVPQAAPDAPGPLALPTPEKLGAALRAAGFTDIQTEVHEAPMYEAETPAALWESLTVTAGPLLSLLAALPEETRQAIREDAVATLTGMFPTGPVALNGSAVIAGATRPR